MSVKQLEVRENRRTVVIGRRSHRNKDVVISRVLLPKTKSQQVAVAICVEKAFWSRWLPTYAVVKTSGAGLVW